jgi:hypothetical protein
MNLEEMKEQIAQKAKAKLEQHLVIFMPFLRLKRGYTVAGVEFLPLHDEDGKVSERLETAEAPLLRILSGYIDRHGKPFDNCVVATIPGRGWDLTTDDLPTVFWATSLLFMASWACNEYLSRFGGSYVNASFFRVVGQAYKGAMPIYIAVRARRRAGGTMDGGYEHGEFKFSIPTQCSIRDIADVDEALLKGLDAANRVDSPTIQRLRTALPFVQLANTDDDAMTEHAEAILMGSAFEQLLNGDASSYKLARKFSVLLNDAGKVTVAEAQKTRPNIQIENDAKHPERATAQPKWWVHRKWMEELYDLRSKVVHKGDHATRKWGWSMGEHLLMAAFVFPLTVKLLLAAEGHYVLTESDQARCFAIDQLLATNNWDEDDRNSNNGPAWQKIVSKAKWDLNFQNIMSKFLKEHPDFLTGGDDDEAEAEAKPSA